MSSAAHSGMRHSYQGLKPAFIGPLLAVIAGALLAPCAAQTGRQASTRHEPLRGRQPEVRALWVVRTTLTSPTAIDTMVATAREGGFNTLLVQVRGRGDAYYLGGHEPRPDSLAGNGAFDPLGETIVRAHAAGLRVHAWVNVNLVSSAVNLPSSHDHVIYQHPEWMMVPRQLAGQLARKDPHSPMYLAELVRYVRAHRTELEGIYLSPLVNAAAEYVANLVGDIVSRYAVDGVHLDYVRFPSDDFDYSQEGLRAFRSSLQPQVSEAELHRHDTQFAADPTIVTRTFAAQWRLFRQRQLTRLLVTIRETVKAARPTALLSAAVVPDSSEAAHHRLQDWGQWLDHGLLDIVCPMAYTTNPSLFASQVSAAKTIAGASSVWAGIAAYRLSSREIADNVRTARRLGADGVVLFSYDELVRSPKGPSYLSEVGRAAFAN